ncbi:MAG: roadblock/LC7 domain-containing protein [Candidatus Heimdallarchaeota archaeon]|nr:MAG: roadblock/LC7 domain-containing protein [Candidatus Heimdallarchaeota archaeon]
MAEDEYVIPSVLQNTIKRLAARRGVKGILVCDEDGLPLQSNLPQSDAERVSAHVASLTKKVRSVSDALNHGRLQSVYVEMPKSEIIITPDEAAGFTIVVLKDRSV